MEPWIRFAQTALVPSTIVLLVQCRAPRIYLQLVTDVISDTGLMRVPPTRVSCARLATHAMEPRHMLCARQVLILWAVLQRVPTVRKEVIATMAAAATVPAPKAISVSRHRRRRCARPAIIARPTAPSRFRAPPVLTLVPRVVHLRTIARNVHLVTSVWSVAVTRNLAPPVLIWMRRAVNLMPIVRCVTLAATARVAPSIRLFAPLVDISLSRTEHRLAIASRVRPVITLLVRDHRLAISASPESSKTQPVRRLVIHALQGILAVRLAPLHRRFVLPGTIRILELQSARRALSVIDVQREALLKSPAQVVTIRIRPGITIAKFVRPAHIKMTPVKSLAGIVRRGPNAPVPA